jgi:hypothetical protein
MTALQELRAESYIGATLWNHTGQAIGLIAVIGRSRWCSAPSPNRSWKWWPSAPRASWNG